MAKKLDLSGFDEEVANEELDLSAFDEPEVEKGSRLEAVARGAGQGLTMGFLDELMASLKAGGVSPSQELSMPVGKAAEAHRAASKRYEEEVAKERAAEAKLREEYPGTMFASELAGGIVPALFTGGAGAAGTIAKEGVKKALPTAMKEGAKLGAKYGAVSGAGYSEADTPMGLLEDVAKGTATGALIGGGLPVVGRAAGAGLDKVKQTAGALTDMVPSVKTGWEFGKKHGLAGYEKIKNLMDSNARGLVKDVKESLNKLGKEGVELNDQFNVTKDIETAIGNVRNLAKSAQTEAEAKKYLDVAAEMESFMLRRDKNLEKLVAQTEEEIRRKTQAAANKEAAAIPKAEGKAVMEAEKRGVELESLEDINKTYEQVSEMPYETVGGQIKGQKAKFKDYYVDSETGDMVPYTYNKKIISDVTKPKFSEIKTGRVGDKVFTEYTDEATGQVFRKEVPGSIFSGTDYSKATMGELLDTISSLGNKVFGNSADSAETAAYKELWKVLRSKLPELSEELPKSKQEMYKLFQIMEMMGINKDKLANPSVYDITELMKKLPKKMDEEKFMIQKYLSGKGDKVGKRIEDIELIAGAEKYLGGEKGMGVSEFTKAGIAQRIASGASNILGTAYGKVAKPVSTVANKVNQFTDSSLKLASRKLNESSNEGIQALGRQLEYALQQEGPMKSALIWSLSQNPAFRKAVGDSLISADERMSEELGEDVRNPLNKMLESSKKPDLTKGQERLIESGGNADYAFGEGLEQDQPLVMKPMDKEPSRSISGRLKKQSDDINLDIDKNLSSTIESVAKNLGYDEIVLSSGRRNTDSTMKILEDRKKKYGLDDFSGEDQKLIDKLLLRGDSPDNIEYANRADVNRVLAERFPDRKDELIEKFRQVRSNFGGFQSSHLQGKKADIPYSFFVDKYGKEEGNRRAAEFINALKNAGLEVIDEKGTGRHGVIDIKIPEGFQPQVQADPKEMEQKVEDAKKAIDRQIRQMGSGSMIPESHIEQTLGTLEALPTDPNSIAALQDEAVKMETYADAEKLKQLLDGLKNMS